MQYVNHNLKSWDPERLARITPSLGQYLRQRRVPALAVRLVHRGQEVYRAAWSGPDMSPDTWGEDTLVRMYSMSKPITTAAALILYEEGRFFLDDPISDYMPAFRRMRVLTGGTLENPETEPARSPITVRHLMMHTSGIVYPAVNGELIERIYNQGGARIWQETIAEMASSLAAMPLAHQPGTAWHYGLSIDLLGRLIEVVSGQPLDQFMHERLFAPLDTVDTGFSVPAAKRGRMATCYQPSPFGSLIPAQTPFDSGDAPAFLCGGGGLWSTLEDYGRFCQMLLNGGELDGERILAPKTVELMTMNHMPYNRIPVVPASWPFREGYGMALGGRTLVDVAASQATGSLGTYTWQGAAGTDFWVDPELELYGITVTQVLPGWYRPAQAFRQLAYQAYCG